MNEDLAARQSGERNRCRCYPARPCRVSSRSGMARVRASIAPAIRSNMANRMRHPPYGGVLLAVGDDHAGESSSVAHQSEQALVASGVPASVSGDRAGIPGSRPARLGSVAVCRCVGRAEACDETAEVTTTVEIDVERSRTLTGPVVAAPNAAVHARIAFDPLGDEARLQRHRLPAVHAFARATALDRIAIGRGGSRLTIVTAGKSYLDTSAALDLLGMSRSRAVSALRCTRSLSSGRLNPQACAQSRRVATKCSW